MRLELVRAAQQVDPRALAAARWLGNVDVVGSAGGRAVDAVLAKFAELRRQRPRARVEGELVGVERAQPVERARERRLPRHLVHARDHVDALVLVEVAHLADGDRAFVPEDVGVAVLGERHRLAPAERARHRADDLRGVLGVLVVAGARVRNRAVLAAATRARRGGRRGAGCCSWSSTRCCGQRLVSGS